jgi:RHS Repeat
MESFFFRVFFFRFFVFVLLSFFSLFAFPQSQNLKYTYDALGRLVQVDDSKNGNRVYTYDPAGNRLSVVVEPWGVLPPKPTGLQSSLVFNCMWQANVEHHFAIVQFAKLFIERFGIFYLILPNYHHTKK